MRCDLKTVTILPWNKYTFGIWRKLKRSVSLFGDQSLCGSSDADEALQEVSHRIKLQT